MQSTRGDRCLIRFLLAATCAASIMLGGVAEARPQKCKTKACLKRTCMTAACKARVAWKHYRRNPMPACTWVGESGGDWRARNPVSTAGGKYQMLDSTFHAYGGPDYPGAHDASQASPLLQERIARRVLWHGYRHHRPQGLVAWVRC